MKDLNKRLVQDSIKYSNINGIAAHEEKVVEEIKKDLKDIKGLKFERDSLGSLAVIKKSKIKNAPTISFTTHMDEVGFLVTSIDSNGFIKFTPIGGWWGHVVLAQKLTITTRTGKEYIGVVGSIPPHLLTRETSQKVVKLNKMFIDLGMTSKKEVEKLGIQVGDMITPNHGTAFQTPNPNRIIGKAHDNRISVVAGVEIMRRLEGKDLDSNVIFVASTQEEVGLRGARTSSYKWTPDVAFAIDVTIGNGTPGLASKETKLGTGVALSMYDSSIIGNPKLIHSVEEVAKKNKISYTFDGLAQGGTDSGVIHLTKDGVLTMTLSIPSRYMHSHVSMIDLKDVQQTVDLLVKYIEEFSNKKMEGLNLPFFY